MQQILLIYGNCHAACISEFLQEIPEVTSVFDVRLQRIMMDGTLQPPCIAEDDWRRVTLIFEQYDRLIPLKYGPAPPNVRRVLFPPMDSLMLWPLQTVDKRSVSKPPEMPWEPYPYGDRAVIEMASGIKRSYSYADYVEYSAKLIPDLDHFIQLDKDRHARRDRHSDVKMSPFLFPENYDQPLFWTFNHPKSFILAELVRQIFAVAEMPDHVDDAPLRKAVEISLTSWNRELMGYQTPLHPAVIDHFNLLVPKDMKYHMRGQYLTHEEWIMQYLHHDFNA